jgi:hypothetical protein
MYQYIKNPTFLLSLLSAKEQTNRMVSTSQEQDATTSETTYNDLPTLKMRLCRQASIKRRNSDSNDQVYLQPFFFL